MSPRKQKSVVLALAKDLDIRVSDDMSRAARTLASRKEQEIKVISFLSSDDITWQTPGRKDNVIIRQKNDKGEKVKLIYQARYMLMSLMEAYKLFKLQNPDQTIGKTKFCEMRPKYIKLYDSLPHNVCVCKYHENVRLLLRALHPFTNLPVNVSTFTDSLVCSSNDESCMRLACADCQDNFSNLGNLGSNDDQIHVNYQQWQSDELNVLRKFDLCSSLQSILDDLRKQLKHSLPLPRLCQANAIECIRKA